MESTDFRVPANMAVSAVCGLLANAKPSLFHATDVVGASLCDEVADYTLLRIPGILWSDLARSQRCAACDAIAEGIPDVARRAPRRRAFTAWRGLEGKISRNPAVAGAP